MGVGNDRIITFQDNNNSNNHSNSSTGTICDVHKEEHDHLLMVHKLTHNFVSQQNSGSFSNYERLELC